MTLSYSTGNDVWLPEELARFRQAADSPELNHVVEATSASRELLRSLSQTIQILDLRSSDNGLFQGLESKGVTFRMQADRQFYADISQIMQLPFAVGSDGDNCWFYSRRRTADGREGRPAGPGAAP